MVWPDDIIAFVGEVAERFGPERIVLFGSYAYGKPNADSDVDLLIVMAHRGPSHRLAAKIRLATGSRFPIDLLVRSSAEIARRVRGNDFFLKEVMDRGLVLHAAGDARVGAEGRKRLRRRLASRAVAQVQPV